MLKRFYSKKSGFTLAEIIVAFAVFAIMASMIAQILDLSISARRSNNIYQAELAEQERLLTLVQKTNKDFSDEKGTITFEIGGTKVSLPYDVFSAKADAAFAEEGLNYFIANVNYQASGEISPGGDSDTGSSGATSGSVMSRLDTRITGTRGIGYIYIYEVIKDTHEYAPDDPYRVPDGHSRYYIQCSASDTPYTSGADRTLTNEDVPFEQYRLFFYDDVKLDASKSNAPYTDENGNTYKKNVYKAANITKVGYLNTKANEQLVKDGLSASKVASGMTDQYNKYKIDQMGTNCVRIGSPYVTNYSGDNPGINGNGDRFNVDTYSNFYIEFDDPDFTITTGSFGYNGLHQTTGSGGDLGYFYAACPMYEEKYNNDGTPKYPTESVAKDMKKYVNIYGANLFTRNYGSSSTPDEGGDEE